ncbi:hypothetical protein SAMN05444007_108240 [Cribrihabitans marinus]|uniref:Uncharacterized protein n=1 Tax=Cribrihabitans marinus TaxID=1227549 RepID=A0A1H7CNZ2_9RHOB|nr:hypothetical protein [Cribrihabitans marinus]GGH36240.1 hypothetical protein GCM10010973_30100 [Cribrihabitans marinus]SEJ91408.1 hypothetical protein SAMN05444007_108240 [Cribrihabitans marinus]
MTTKKAAKPAAKKAPRKRKLDLARLRRLADELAEYGRGDLSNLVHRWEAEEGAKFDEAGTAGSRIRLAGITATSTAGQRGAVTNWGQAARRALLKGGV